MEKTPLQQTLICPRCRSTVYVHVRNVIALPGDWQLALSFSLGLINLAICGRCGVRIPVFVPLLFLNDSGDNFILIEYNPDKLPPRQLLETYTNSFHRDIREKIINRPLRVYTSRTQLYNIISLAFRDRLAEKHDSVYPSILELYESWLHQTSAHPKILSQFIDLDEIGMEAFFVGLTNLAVQNEKIAPDISRLAMIFGSKFAHLRAGLFEHIPISHGAHYQLRRFGRKLIRDVAQVIFDCDIPNEDRELIFNIVKRFWDGGQQEYIFANRRQINQGLQNSVDIIVQALHQQADPDLRLLGNIFKNLFSHDLPMAYTQNLMQAIINTLGVEPDPLSPIVLIEYALENVPEMLQYYNDLFESTGDNNQNGRFKPDDDLLKLRERISEKGRQLKALIPYRQTWMDALHNNQTITPWKSSFDIGTFKSFNPFLMPPGYLDFLEDIIRVLRENRFDYDADQVELMTIFFRAIMNLGEEKVNAAEKEMKLISSKEQLFKVLAGKAFLGNFREMILFSIYSPDFHPGIIKRLKSRKEIEKNNKQAVDDEAWEYFLEQVDQYERAIPMIEFIRQLLVLQPRDYKALKRDLAHPVRRNIFFSKIFDLFKFISENRLHPIVNQLNSSIESILDNTLDPFYLAIIKFNYGSLLCDTEYFHKGTDLLLEAMEELAGVQETGDIKLAAYGLLVNLTQYTGKFKHWGRNMRDFSNLSMFSPPPTTEYQLLAFFAHLHALSGFVPFSEAQALQPINIFQSAIAPNDQVDYDKLKQNVGQIDPLKNPKIYIQLVTQVFQTAQERGEIGDALLYSTALLNIGDKFEIPVVSYLGRKFHAITLFISEQELEPAEHMCMEALNLARKYSIHEGLLSIPIMLARLYMDHGQYQKAISYLLPLYHELMDEPGNSLGYLASAAASLAELYYQMRNEEAADAIIATTRAVIPATNDFILGDWLRLSLDLTHAGWRADQDYIKKTLSTADAFIHSLPGMEGNPAILDTLVQIAAAKLQLAKLMSRGAPDDLRDSTGKDALEVYKEIIVIARRTRNYRAIRLGLAGIAQCLEHIVDPGQIGGDLIGYLRELFEEPNALPSITWLAAVASARYFMRLNEFARAILAFQKAIDILETVGSSFAEAEAVMRYFQGKIDIYGELILCCILEGQHEDAIHFSERAKSKALVRLMLGGKKTTKSNEILREAGGLEKEEMSFLLDEMDTLTKTRTTLIEFFIHGNTLYTFLLNRRTYRIFYWPIDISRYDELALNASRGRIDFGDLSHLYQDIWSPILASGHLDDTESMIVIPHGQLHRIPFTSAWDVERQNAISDKFVVSTSPSVRVVKICLERWKKINQSRNPLLVVQDPTGTLEFCEEEVNAILQIANDPSSLVPTRCTQQQYLELSKQAGLIHFAGHAEFDLDNPMNSGLKMSDGTLTAGRIIESMKTSSRLVTLSACETSQTQVTEGEEILGLPRALLFAGAAGIVGSLWISADKSTSLLMEQFYKNLFSTPDQPLKPASALRNAKSWLRNQKDAQWGISYSDPIFWAGFISIGI